MRRVARVVLFLVSVACSTAQSRKDLMHQQCLTAERAMAPLVGKNLKQVYLALGTPDAVTPDGEGGQILTYKSQLDLGYSENMGFLTTTQTHWHHDMVRNLFISPQGVVTAFRCQ